MGTKPGLSSGFRGLGRWGSGNQGGMKQGLGYRVKSDGSGAQSVGLRP